MTQKKILLNAFNMNCVGHINHGLWAHPRDTSSRYTDLDYWTSLARTLERGKFDGMFLADIVGVQDVYQGSAAAALRHGVQVPLNDPMLLVPAMAHATRHLGFGVTSNLTADQSVHRSRRRRARRRTQLCNDARAPMDCCRRHARGHVALSVAQAKVIAHRAALSVSEQLFDACGARVAHAPLALDRFWRNARTHTLHDPLDYKLRDIGRFALEGVLPQASLYA